MSRPNRRPQRFILLAAMIAVALPWLTGCGEEPVPLGTTTDGKSVAVLKLDDKEQYVEKNGRRVGGKYDSITNLTYTPDGEVVFAASSGGNWTVMRGEKQVGDRYGYVGNVTVSSTGAVAFVGREGDKWRVVRDGVAMEGAFDQVTGHAFSSDGTSFAFTAEKDGEPVIVRNGVRIPVDFEWVSAPRFSLDGQSLFCTGGDEKGSMLIKDGQPVSERYLAIDYWTVSPDGNSVAMLVEGPGGHSIVKNDTLLSEEHPQRGRLGQPVFAPDGRTVVYIALPLKAFDDSGEGQVMDPPGWYVYRDGIPSGEPIYADSVGEMIFSPDGQSVAFVVRKAGRWFVGRDGRVISGAFDQIERLRNSSDGKSLLYSGRLMQKVEEFSIPW